MNDREKQILKILRRNPLIQQNEIADILQISRSRVAAHIMDLMRKGLIKGKGYILTEQDYCVVVGAINMDIRGMADIRYPQAASHPCSVHCSAGGVGRNIAHNGSAWSGCAFNISYWQRFLRRDITGRNAPRGRERFKLHSSAWTQHCNLSRYR